eukprot:COSAG02_NODE_46187_length_351_cov_0.607143_1_plen_75_part_10
MTTTRRHLSESADGGSVEATVPGEGGPLVRLRSSQISVEDVRRESRLNPFQNATSRPGLLDWTKILLLLPLALLR